MNFYFLDFTGDPETKKFSLLQIENLDYLSEIGKRIADYLAKNDSNTPIKPKKEEIVLANFEGTFYRGVCKEKSNEGFLVFYIDYGNSAVVKEEDMRPFDKSLMFDIVVHSCLIENFPNEFTDTAAAIISQEDGIPMEKARKTKDGYVVSIVGL